MKKKITKSTEKIFSKETVAKISNLANIPIKDAEKSSFADGFNTTINVVNKLFSLNVVNIEPAHQVTGLENIYREDKIDEERMFSQDEALKNTTRKHNGYFVVDQVIEQEDN
jgi:aspartyl/glutamyl-tRNA(Asn/Gln) amidotransferase C subunit